jgi:hypothetical protein
MQHGSLKNGLKTVGWLKPLFLVRNLMKGHASRSRDFVPSSGQLGVDRFDKGITHQGIVEVVEERSP